MEFLYHLCDTFSDSRYQLYPHMLLSDLSNCFLPVYFGSPHCGSTLFVCFSFITIRLQKRLPAAKLRIYKTFIMPQLTHFQTVWHFCRASDGRKIEYIQERALRATHCDKNSTYKVLLARVNLPTLINRRLQEIAIVMYKFKNNLCPSYIRDIFHPNDSRYNLRDSQDFANPRVNTTTFKLRGNIKNSETISIFKKQIRKVDMGRLILNNDCKNCHLCNF